MNSLIVLGLIPGTHIQITFAAWLIAAAATLALLVMLFVRRKRLLLYLVLSWRLRQTIRRQQLA